MFIFNYNGEDNGAVLHDLLTTLARHHFVITVTGRKRLDAAGLLDGDAPETWQHTGAPRVLRHMPSGQPAFSLTFIDKGMPRADGSFWALELWDDDRRATIGTYVTLDVDEITAIEVL